MYFYKDNNGGYYALKQENSFLTTISEEEYNSHFATIPIPDNISRITELKNKLFNTDYQAIKFAEGELSEEEYAPIREQRRNWRKEINELCQ